MTCPHWPTHWSVPAKWCATAKCCCFLLSRNVHLCHPSISERAMLFQASSSLLKRESSPMNSEIIQLTGQLQNPGISLGSSQNRVNSLIQYSNSIWASLVGIPKIVKRDKKLLNRNVFLKTESRNVTFADICEAGKYQYLNHPSSMQALTVTFSGFQHHTCGRLVLTIRENPPEHSLPLVSHFKPGLTVY